MIARNKGKCGTKVCIVSKFQLLLLTWEQNFHSDLIVCSIEVVLYCFKTYGRGRQTVK
jgi:hypothetical protein